MSQIAHWGWAKGHWLTAASPAQEAYHILHIAFSAVPIVAGLDKFFNVLVSWEQYLAPSLAQWLGENARQFMYAVGVVEIIVGIGVAMKPKIFAYVLSAWMLVTVINLLASGYFDIALRDVGLCIGAFILARLSREYDHLFERRVA